MTIQVLSAKSTRRLARTLGEPTITRAWVNNVGSHDIVHFATWDHIHGAYDRRGNEIAWLSDPFGHVPACYDGPLGDLLLDLDPYDDDGRWPIQGYDR